MGPDSSGFAEFYQAMDDNEMLTLIRESFSGIRAATPLSEAVRRGGALRARRRARAVAGAAAIAGTGLAAVAVLTSGQAERPAPPDARLAAWTVTTGANGTVDVTIRQLTDAAGLQRTLRADGIPARVVFDTAGDGPGRGEPVGAPDISVAGASAPGPHDAPARRTAPTASQAPAECAPFTSLPVREADRVIVKIVGTLRDMLQAWERKGAALTLHPASIPSGAGLYLAVEPGSTQLGFTWSLYLVKASPSCTGA